MSYVKKYCEGASYECTIYYKDSNCKIIHREDGPAIEYINGCNAWYINGKLHREEGPAVKNSDGSTNWYINGKLHREDGPAIEWKNGRKIYWLNDILYEEQDYWAKVKLGAFV